MVDVHPEDAAFGDLVQVRAEGSFASGLLVGKGHILTALHCVAWPDCRPRDRLQVHLRRDLTAKNGKYYEARIVWPAALIAGIPDLAVLAIEGADVPEASAHHRFGDLPLAPTTGSARGYPAVAAGEGLKDDRLERDEPGRVHFTSLTRRELMLDATTRHKLKGRDRWKGLSGGPLLANGRIVGVMREVPDDYVDDPVVAEPLALCLRGPDGAALERLLGIDRPLDDPTDADQLRLFESYRIIGQESAAASEHTFSSALKQPFHGREGDLRALDEALAAHGRGIVLLHGEAGLGKSRLLADLAERLAARPGVTVLRHAFSLRETLSATRGAMIQNFVRQAADLLGPAALGPGAAGDAGLADRFARLLAADREERRPLVVVIDALDEAAGGVDPWKGKLGSGVYIVASCRVPIGMPPRTYSLWHLWATETAQLILDLPLRPLGSAAIAHWYSDTLGRRVDASDPAVADIMRAADGVPLFTRFVLEDFATGRATAANAGFVNYAKEKLEELRDRLTTAGSRWSWGDVKRLFTVLVIAKAPIFEMALLDLVTPHLLDELDERARRWLVRHDGQVSFIHPRLAIVFRDALPMLPPDLAGVTRTALSKTCDEAWTACAIGGDTSHALLPYALAWLPAHLLDAGKLSEAADLLGDAKFIKARLAAAPNSVTVHRTATETMRVQARVDAEHPVFAWGRFWTETESRVTLAMENARNLNSDPIDLFVQLAVDRLGADRPEAQGLQINPNSPHLMAPCGFQFPRLRRSLEDLHLLGTSIIRGVQRYGDMLVSWGKDGFVRRLSLEGEPVSRDEGRAHDGEVSGLLALPHGLVSWGVDGAVRFYDAKGNSRTVEPQLCHAGGVESVQLFEGGLASRDAEGLVRCWSHQGDHLFDWRKCEHRIAGAFVQADRLMTWNRRALYIRQRDGAPRKLLSWDRWWHGIDEFVDCDDRLVSYGLYALRVWSPDGELLGGGPGEQRINGLLPLDHGFVTWNTEGAIMFWTRDGRRRKGGSDKAHQASVEGIIRLDDALVSWGFDGAIRFWSYEGDPLEGGDLHAHSSQTGVHGVAIDGDRLISWGGRDIRFWSRAGAPLTGTIEKAHEGIVLGVLPLDDSYLSWGAEGAVRLWARAEPPLALDWKEAHSAWVTELAATPEAIVSCGYDGRVRFWSKTGELRTDRDGKDHPRWATGLLTHPEGVVSWGDDGSVRFWTNDGKLLFGPSELGIEENDPTSYLDRLRAWIVWESNLTMDGPLLSGIFGDQVKGVISAPDEAVYWTSKQVWRCAVDQDEWQEIFTAEDYIDYVIYFQGKLVIRTIEGETFSGRPGGEMLPDSNFEALGPKSYGYGRLALPESIVKWDDDGGLRFLTFDGGVMQGGSPTPHHGGMKSAFVLADRLVTVGKSGDVRQWNWRGAPIGTAWIAPAELEACSPLDGEVWVYMLGKPRRLVLGDF